MMAKQRKLKGFTIVEMAIVILILGITAAAVAPGYLSAIANHRIESASRRLMADLKLAQTEAQRTSSTKVVSFDIASNLYILLGVSDFNRPGQDYSVSFGQSEYQVKMTSADFNSLQKVSFDLYGRPDSAGTVIITNGTKIHTIKVSAEGLITRVITG